MTEKLTLQELKSHLWQSTKIFIPASRLYINRWTKMSNKEAKARIKINKLLENAGWRFFDDEDGKTNIQLENNVVITKTHFDEFGEDFEKTGKGFVDFLLLNDKGFPLVVLEAKRESKNPLDGNHNPAFMRLLKETSFLNWQNTHRNIQI